MKYSGLKKIDLLMQGVCKYVTHMWQMALTKVLEMNETCLKTLNITDVSTLGHWQSRLFGFLYISLVDIDPS